MTFFDTLKKALEEETKNLKVGLSSVKKDLEENLREGANSLGSFLREPKEGKDFMRFDLSEEEAKIIKKNLSRTDLSPVGTNPTTIKRGIAETVQATPRGLAGLALQGAEFMTKPITGKKEEPVNIPKLFQPLFGSDPIKRTGETEEKKDFEVGLKHYGEPGEVADPIATGTMLFMAGLDLFGGGSGKIPKEITEQLIKKYGDDVAKEIIKKGGKNLATVAIKEGGEEVVKKSGIVVSGKITPQLEPLAQEARAIAARGGTVNEFIKIKKPVYHGTKADFTEFDPQFLGQATGGKSASEGFFFTSKKAVADTYAKSEAIARKDMYEKVLDLSDAGKHSEANKLMNEFLRLNEEVAKKPGRVVIAYLDMKNPKTVNLKGQEWGDFSFTEIIQIAKKEGYDSVLIRNVKDIAGEVKQGVLPESDISIVFSKNQIKTKSQLTDFYEQAVRGFIPEGVSAKGVSPQEPRLPEAPVREVATPEDLKAVARAGKEAVRPPLLGDTPVSETISPQTRSKGETKGGLLGGGKSAKSLDSTYNKLGKDASVFKEADKKLSPTKLGSEKFSLYKKFKEAVSRNFLGVREFVQDDWIRVKKLVERKDIKVSDASNPYEKEILYRGKIDTRITRGKEVVREVDTDLVNTAKKLNMGSEELQDDVNRYLISKHAPERNVRFGDGAAGITTAKAKEELQELASLPQGIEVARIANKIFEFNKETLDILLEGGVIDKKLHTLLRKTYKNHVPLQRIFEETEDVVDVLVGRGLDVKGTGLQRAKGSERAVRDILSNVTANYEQAVVRAEKNIVDNATLQFARDNKHLGIFEEIHPKAIGKTFDKRIIQERITDPSVLVLRENGKPVFLKINDAKLAVALRGVNRQKLDVIMRAVQAITRFYSMFATRFNPEFAFPNKIRDLQEVMIYTASKGEMGAKGAVKTLTEERRSAKAIYDFIRGKDTEGARFYKQMKADGGTTGGLGLSTRQQIELDIDKIHKLNRSKPRQAAELFMRRVDDWNTIFEDSTRLSVYRAALARGASRQRAAVMAKEASVNFNKFGTGGPVINALYMFANASIQGSAKMLMAMKNPKVAGMVTLAVGTAVAVTRQWNDQVDPDWRDKVSKWDKLNSLVVVMPSGEGEGIKYVSIPVSWGMKPIKVAMDYAYDLAVGQGIDIGETMKSVVAAIIEGYNPIGGTDIFSAITPTVLDMPVELGRNKAWHGNAIRPEWDRYAPNSILYFGDLGESAIGKAFIEATTKISELSDGRIEISPADVSYAYEQIIGGAGRTASKTINTIISVGKQEVPPSREVPFLSRFFRSIPEERIGAGAKETQGIRNILAEQSRERFNISNAA